MDFGDIAGNIPFILLVIGLILLQFFLRRRKPELANREIVRNLLSEVKLNHALAESFHLRQRLRKFEVTSWERHKNKLDFLKQSVQTALADAFMMVDDFNRQIETFKKHKSTGYMASMDVDKVKKPLAKSQEGLEQWLQTAVGVKEPSPEYPSITDDLFGSRR